MTDAASAESGGSDSKRLKILDVYKGMAIMGVIITHLVLIQNGTDGKEGDPSALVQFMFSGLIMFMVVSGYFYKPGKSYLENVKKRIVPLVVIYVAAIVVLSTIMYVYLLAVGYDLSDYSLPELLFKSLVGKCLFMDETTSEFIENMAPFGPADISIMMYYLMILSLGYLIFFAIADRVLKDWRVAVVTILILFGITSLYMEFIHIHLPLMAYYAPMVAGFLLVGALLAKVDFARLLQEGYRTKKFWMIFGIAVVAAALCLILFPAQTDIVWGRVGTGPFRVYTFAATSLSCGIVQMYVAVLFMKIPGIYHLFNDMGKNVLYLFLLHMFIAKMIIAPFVELPVNKYIPLEFMPALALAFGTIAVILVLSHIYTRIKPDIVAKICKKGKASEE